MKYKGYELLKAIEYKEIPIGSLVMDIDDGMCFEVAIKYEGENRIVYLDNYNYWMTSERLLNHIFKVVDRNEGE